MYVEDIMNKSILIVAVVAAAWLSVTPARAQGKLNVMATTEDLASIAREVGGDRITRGPSPSR